MNRFLEQEIDKKRTGGMSGIFYRFAKATHFHKETRRYRGHFFSLPHFRVFEGTFRTSPAPEARDARATTPTANDTQLRCFEMALATDQEAIDERLGSVN